MDIIYYYYFPKSKTILEVPSYMRSVFDEYYSFYNTYWHEDMAVEICNDLKIDYGFLGETERLIINGVTPIDNKNDFIKWVKTILTYKTIDGPFDLTQFGKDIDLTEDNFSYFACESCGEEYLHDMYIPKEYRSNVCCSCYDKFISNDFDKLDNMPDVIMSLRLWRKKEMPNTDLVPIGLLFN